MEYKWFTSHDLRLRDNIIAILNRDLLSLPKGEDFITPIKPLLRPHTEPFRHAILGQAKRGRGGARLPSPTYSATVCTPRSKPLDELSELTLTYVNILRRSEDFNRRAILKGELNRRLAMKRTFDAFNAMVPVLLDEYRALQATETQSRGSIDKEMAECHSKLLAMESVSVALAQRREGSRPQCHILSKGRGLLLAENALERSFVELSWRGGVDLSLVAVVLDMKGSIVGVATSGEGIRTKGRLLLLRPMNDYDGNSGNGVGGSHMTFQLNLSGCPVTVSRIVFCVCPRGVSATLAALRQSWLTISDLYEEKHRQIQTIIVNPLPFYGSIIVGSLRRRDDRLWQFFNESTSILGHRRPQSIAQVLAEDAQSPYNETVEREMYFSRAHQELKETEERERLCRALIHLTEEFAIAPLQHACMLFAMKMQHKRPVVAAVAPTSQRSSLRHRSTTSLM